MTKFYGASGSLALVMLFVFYSSIIFYYGACFVYSYSERTGLPIHLVGKAYTPEQRPAAKGQEIS
jgi:membrane protein